MSLFYNKNECSVAYVKISEIFENDKLIVPAYQRKYAWGKEQINQFLDSISELVELIREASVNKVEIILGQIILLLNNDGDFEIIDGQQRLTTISLLAIYLIHSLEGYKSNEHISANLNEKIITTLSGLKKIVYYDEKNNSLILRDVADKDIYNKLIKNEKVKNCKLKTAYNKIKSYFEEDENNADDLTVKIENIVQWAKVLIDKIIVIKNVIKDEKNAFGIFETLNSRGVSLTSFDLIHGWITENIDKWDYDNKTLKVKYDSTIRNLNEKDEKWPKTFLSYWINATKNNSVAYPQEYNEFVTLMGNNEVMQRNKQKDIFTNMLESFDELMKFYSDDGNALAKCITWANRKKIMPLYVKLKKIENSCDLLKESASDFLKKVFYLSLYELNLLQSSPGKFQYKIKKIMDEIDKFVSSSKKFDYIDIVDSVDEIKKLYLNIDESKVFEPIFNSQISDFSFAKVLLTIAFDKCLDVTKLDFKKIDGDHIFPKDRSEIESVSRISAEEYKNIINTVGNIRLISKRDNIKKSNKGVSEIGESNDLIRDWNGDLVIENGINEITERSKILAKKWEQEDLLDLIWVKDEINKRSNLND